MRTASFQCPDSGLIVHVDVEGRVFGDPDDWEEMGATQDAIDDTYAWMKRFRNELAKQFKMYGGKRMEAFDTAIVSCDGHIDDINELTW